MSIMICLKICLIQLIAMIRRLQNQSDVEQKFQNYHVMQEEEEDEVLCFL